MLTESQQRVIAAIISAKYRLVDIELAHMPFVLFDNNVVDFSNESSVVIEHIINIIEFSCYALDTEPASDLMEKVFLLIKKKKSFDELTKFAILQKLEAHIACVK